MVWHRFNRVVIRGPGFHLYAGRSQKQPGHTWGPRGRELGMHGFLLLAEGAGAYRDSDGRREPVVAGDLLLLFPGLRHDYGPGPGQLWRELFLDCDGGIMALLATQGLLDRRRPLRHPPVDALAPLRRLIEDVEAHRIADPAEAQLRLHGAILALARWSHGAEDAALDAGRRSLAADLARPFDPRAAADAAGMGWELFRKRFRARYGLPPGRWRLQARCEAAGDALLAGATVEAAAEQLGFCDGAHLRRHFRRLLGLAPEGWRRLHGGA